MSSLNVNVKGYVDDDTPVGGMAVTPRQMTQFVTGLSSRLVAFRDEVVRLHVAPPRVSAPSHVDGRRHASASRDRDDRRDRELVARAMRDAQDAKRS
jgi:hypothetical protein